MPAPEGRSGRPSLLITGNKFPSSTFPFHGGLQRIGRGPPHCRAGGLLPSPPTQCKSLLENTFTPQAEIKLASHRGIPWPVRGHLKPTTSPNGEREKGPGQGPVVTLADSLTPPLAEPQAELMREEGVGKDVVLSV